MLTYTSWLLAVASYLIEQVVSNFLLLLSVGSRSVFLNKVGKSGKPSHVFTFVHFFAVMQEWRTMKYLNKSRAKKNNLIVFNVCNCIVISQT